MYETRAVVDSAFKSLDSSQRFMLGSRTLAGVLIAVQNAIDKKIRAFIGAGDGEWNGEDCTDDG